MPSARFKPATPAIERPQTYALHHTATDIGIYYILHNMYTQFRLGQDLPARNYGAGRGVSVLY
jgi:hypothetical protein